MTRPRAEYVRARIKTAVENLNNGEYLYFGKQLRDAAKLDEIGTTTIQMLNAIKHLQTEYVLCFYGNGAITNTGTTFKTFLRADRYHQAYSSFCFGFVDKFNSGEENELPKRPPKAGAKFKPVFGKAFTEYYNPFTGFDIVKFDEDFFPDLPDGVSLKDAVLEKYGQESVDLIQELIS